MNKAALLAALLAALGVIVIVERDALWTAADEGARDDAPDHAWPPVKGEPLPAITLPDAVSGETVDLSELRGKVLIVEPIGMKCPACNAYAGGLDRGGFRGARVQDLPAFEDLLWDYGGVEARDEPDLVYVQLLLYDTSNRREPDMELAREWVEHFGMDAWDNALVLVGDERYVNRASYAMVPGFFLVDRDGTVVADGTGHRPVDHPYEEVLARAGELLGR